MFTIMVITGGTRRRCSAVEIGRNVITRNSGSRAGARIAEVALMPASETTAAAMPTTVIATGSCGPEASPAGGGGGAAGPTVDVSAASASDTPDAADAPDAPDAATVPPGFEVVVTGHPLRRRRQADGAGGGARRGGPSGHRRGSSGAARR